MVLHNQKMMGVVEQNKVRGVFSIGHNITWDLAILCCNKGLTSIITQTLWNNLLCIGIPIEMNGESTSLFATVTSGL